MLVQSRAQVLILAREISIKSTTNLNHLVESQTQRKAPSEGVKKQLANLKAFSSYKFPSLFWKSSGKYWSFVEIYLQLFYRFSEQIYRMLQAICFLHFYFLVYGVRRQTYGNCSEHCNQSVPPFHNKSHFLCGQKFDSGFKAVWFEQRCLGFRVFSKKESYLDIHSSIGNSDQDHDSLWHTQLPGFVKVKERDLIICRWQ